MKKILRKTFAASILLLLLVHIDLKAQGIEFFKGTWEQALQKAKTEKKLIFLDGYTTWCVPCAELSKTVFPRKDMGDFFNAHFISIQMDMEKGIGVNLSKSFEISAYPTLVIANSSGFKISDIVGLRNPNEYLKWAEDALAVKPTVSDDELLAQGKIDEVFINQYFLDLVKEGKTFKARLKLNELYNAHGAVLLQKKYFYELLPLAEIDSPMLMYVVKNRRALYKLYGKSDVDAKIRALYVNSKYLTNFLRMPASKGIDEQPFRAYIQKMRDQQLPDVDFLAAEVEFFMYCKRRDYDQAVAIMEKSLDRAPVWMYYDFLRMANWEFIRSEPRAKILPLAKEALTLPGNEPYLDVLKKVYDELLNRGMGSFYPSTILMGFII
ncbi:Thioredoxin-like [Pedobacter sp. ok626]|uniref:thioredoxin family protein n=1 Tax=Pedobacter sp. ok626 TaxID=1761882 RepID=UPI00088CD82B|nr:thioredoxin family protein [Pedobacter sp. ok626]SDL66244.1 Thioredoxin-like [Pedobacter sp. ok626]